LTKFGTQARSVACITYTNAAVQEIESRLRLHIQPGDDSYYDICTIHSFCLNHVFRPFCHLIKGYSNGFKLLTPESGDFQKHATAIWGKHGRYNLTFRDFDEFTQLRMGPDGNARVGTGGSLTPEIAIDYWKRIREAGFVDFANIIYYSFYLLRHRPEILSYVSSKFAWILLDEFQDTTDLQVEILALISDQKRTRFFLVGDPCCGERSTL
jgi:DNA helicase II / ATP-dependent DNA helicase PcrA